MTAYQHHPTLAAYEAAPTFSTWVGQNVVKDSMLWKGGYLHQLEWMPGLAAHGAHSEPRVLATHRSKSIDLPVPAIILGNPSSEWAVMLVRDNFHDVNVAVVSNVPLHIDRALVLSEMSREAYQAEKKRAIDYMGKDRISDAQWEDGSWYERWTSGSLEIHDNKIYVAPRAYAEGISKVPGVCVDPYKGGSQAFATVTNGRVEDVMAFFGRLAADVKSNLNP